MTTHLEKAEIYEEYENDKKIETSLKNYYSSLIFRVSVQGVESLGGHFATLCQEFDFYEVKKIIVFKKSKIAQIYYYEP